MSRFLGFAPTDKPNYYFVSYNSEDAATLIPLLSILRTTIPLWYDYGIPYGEEWNKEIADKIEGAEAILLFITNKLFKKGSKSYVYKEYEIARTFFDKRVYVILLERIGRDVIPNELKGWWIDLSNSQCIESWTFADNNELAKEISRLVQPKAKDAFFLRDLSTNERYPLGNGDNYIGRTPRKCTIVLPYNRISRLHCCIRILDNRAYMLDLGSENKTYVNGQAIVSHTSVPIDSGDQIQLAGYPFALEHSS